MSKRLLLTVLAGLALAACEGPAGPGGADGAQGPAGEGLPGADGADGTNGVDGVDGVNGVEGADGVDGVDGVNGTDGVDGVDGTNGVDGIDGIDGINGADGADGVAGPQGPAGEGYFPLDLGGVVGEVTDASGETVTAGTVYFVPAADVAALPPTTIAAASPDDEPLEDLIAGSGGSFQQAVVGADGRWALGALAAGSYYVTFVPDAADPGHLPGGSACRVALTSAELVGTRLDLVVSSATPSNAEFVGSGPCLTCHGRTHFTETMHRLGIWSPYEAGPLQRQGARRDEMWLALDTKFTAAGTVVYFYDYDATRGFDKYKTSETDPGANVSFTVTTRENAGVYEMLLTNVRNPADPPQVYRVDSVYGGGVYKQRYMTKVTNAFGFFNAILPLQFQTFGQDVALYGRTSKVWRDYHGDWYYNEATSTFKAQAASKSFEKNCISCHAVGTQITGSDATTWTASTVQDPMWGDFDYDGNGTPDEMNLGCETCHGPGSRHWEAAGQGVAIVSPSLLTPEREAAICGQCHSRPKGALGTDSPVNAAGKMMIAGTSRAEFLTSYATTQLDGAATDYFGDVDRHSKSHHQQYSDFIRTGMYKNDRSLMTCSDCHDPHARPNPRQLRVDANDNAQLCGGSCHQQQANDVAAHLDTVLAPGLGGMMAMAKCTDCHMPNSVKTGAGSPGIAIGATQYWQADDTSHLFAVPDKANSAKVAPGFDMPTGYTNVCSGACHQSL